MPRLRSALLAVALVASAAWTAAGGAAAPAADVPARLADGEFRRLVETLSEPGGTFHSDNFISNEGRFQDVMPELVARVRPGGVYLGVGPEQNFSYIAAVRPRLAFIVDIRRGNLHEHLLYKALFELSADRADFLSRLFSRRRPPGLSVSTPVEALFSAYRDVAPAADAYAANLKAVIDLLNGQHRLALSREDQEGIDYVYRTAFFRDGPQLGYALTGSGRAGGVPSYAELMAMTDAAGKQWSYLSSEERFAFVRDLEARNLIVPVVGNFGGPKALRAVGAHVRSLGAQVSAFYLSNVEQYLRQDGLWEAFCANVASLPLEPPGTFIRSVRGGGRGPGGLSFVSSLGDMVAETRGCAVR